MLASLSMTVGKHLCRPEEEDPIIPILGSWHVVARVFPFAIPRAMLVPFDPMEAEALPLRLMEEVLSGAGKWDTSSKAREET
jgi:hypothetical protein